MEFPQIRFFNEVTTATTPGTYDSKIVSVVPVEGSDFDDKFRIIYELYDENGTIYKFSEIFVNDGVNRRCNKFNKYLASNGVKLGDYGAYIGVCENVDIQFNDKYLNIVDRRFVCVAPTSTTVSAIASTSASSTANTSSSAVEKNEDEDDEA